MILPPASGDSPFLRVFLELENVDQVLGQKKIKFNPNEMTFKVTSEDGELDKTAAGAYDGMKPLWQPILLPCEGTIKFRISFPGMGHSPSTKPIIDLDPPNVWIIPQNGKTYYLSGSLTIPRDYSEHPTMVWHGTLSFPPIEIPMPK